MSHPERGFWRDAFLAAEVSALLRTGVRRISPQEAATLCADFADAAVAEFRHRVTWRSP